MSRPAPTASSAKAGAAIDAARRLLLDHADRAVTGVLTDPAVLAAVVGVERLVTATGFTDAEHLRAVLAAAQSGEGPAHLGTLVAESERHVLAGIRRRDTGQRADGGTINPDAGSYPVTTDAALVRAAVRAGQQSFDRMPYYRIRYGEKGSRFASSDSAWLVSLARLPEARAVHHVEWLARVLAGRGMPAWLLETHLGLLAEEVRGVDPAAVGALPATAVALGRARRRHVEDALLEEADTWVVDALGDAQPVPRTGALLAAATADAWSGVTEDDRPLVDWLTHPSRSGPDGSRALLRVRTFVRERARR